ncbi:MAG: type II secretion system protein N [Candidatus Thiodiazotropha sp. (ex Ctena orbiculata)]|nr:type II secretion system protein N [Candidatus Thiodiazotropha sp. (ex Codakia orbicularis)]MBV2124484.1 type II secretion system protein N [Candidatus Thiodiazotropha taylori]
MRWWSFLLIGLGGYLIFLLAGTPAQHIIGWALAENGKLPFSYATMKGSLWRGKMEAINYQGMPLDKIKWRFAPSGLLLGRISFDLELRHMNNKVDANVARTLGGIQLKNVEGQLPASMITDMADLNQISVEGDVELNLSHVAIETERVTSAEGEIKWLNPALLRPFSLKEGNLKADLTTDDNGNINIKINDLGGGTSVDGELSLSNEGNYTLNGAIKPGAGSDPGLSSALKAVAKSQPDGSYRISFSGSL